MIAAQRPGRRSRRGAGDGGGGWFLTDAKTGVREPIGQRVLEIPENLEQFENRDTHSRLMKPVVAHLTLDDMIALAAYLSSQAP